MRWRPKNSPKASVSSQGIRRSSRRYWRSWPEFRSGALQRGDEVMEGLAVGFVEAHQDTVSLQRLGLPHVLGLVLRRQVGQTLRARQRRVDDVEHLIEAHRLQQSSDVRMGGDQGRQHADLLPRQDRQLGQQAQRGAVDASALGQIDDDGREIQRREDLLDRRIQRRTERQTDLTNELQNKGAIHLGELDSTSTHARFLLNTSKAISSGMSASSTNPKTRRKPSSVPPASEIRPGNADSFSLSVSPGKRSRMPSESKVRLKVSGSF